MPVKRGLTVKLEGAITNETGLCEKIVQRKHALSAYGNLVRMRLGCARNLCKSARKRLQPDPESNGSQTDHTNLLWTRTIRNQASLCLLKTLLAEPSISCSRREAKAKNVTRFLLPAQSRIKRVSHWNWETFAMFDIIKSHGYVKEKKRTVGCYAWIPNRTGAIITDNVGWVRNIRYQAFYHSAAVLHGMVFWDARSKLRRVSFFRVIDVGLTAQSPIERESHSTLRKSLVEWVRTIRNRAFLVWDRIGEGRQAINAIGWGKA
ncbi:hypothetical protein DFH07DRAFT_782831 [Mycena maculata]|uniref:Uncharacterized protein n=1 Tax=Mycena maculata TaxID=230809 RepID=A0AAD7HQV9_9AGAR|nr:hypothetical protein DFH07DRAFT_782831 [Mycena maculata]